MAAALPLTAAFASIPISYPRTMVDVIVGVRMTGHYLRLKLLHVVMSASFTRSPTAI